MIQYILEGPYVPLVAWTVAVAAVTQAYKRAMRAAGVRHYPVVERTLPLVPCAIGGLTGAAFPHELGLSVILADGPHSMRIIGGFFGVGVGLVSAGAFQALVHQLPEESPLRERLVQNDPEAGGK